MATIHAQLTAQIQVYIRTCSTEQLRFLADVIHASKIYRESNKSADIPNVQTRTNLEPVNQNPSLTIGETGEKHILSAKSPMAGRVEKSRIKSLQNGRKADRASNASTQRPLNSWMAFRAYYSPLFPAHQQKAISGILTLLWKEDPCKDKWAMIAKAYSMIKDFKGKELAPLNPFLEIVCTRFEMLSPDSYLSFLGWEMVTINDELTVVRHNTRQFPNLVLGHDLSIDSIFSHCQEVGYITVDDKVAITSNQTTGDRVIMTVGRSSASRSAMQDLSSTRAEAASSSLQFHDTIDGSTGQMSSASVQSQIEGGGSSTHDPSSLINTQHSANSASELTPIVIHPRGLPAVNNAIAQATNPTANRTQSFNQGTENGTVNVTAIMATNERRLAATEYVYPFNNCFNPNDTSIMTFFPLDQAEDNFDVTSPQFEGMWVEDNTTQFNFRI